MTCFFKRKTKAYKNIIWGYPNGTLTYTGASNYRWLYSEVGGDGLVDNLPFGYYPEATWCDTTSTKNIAGKEGTLDNHVYLFSAIEQKSDNNPVLRNGESETNNGVITISGITPGTYYVLAFYDYASGGNETNIFNRYDRYALYAETGGLTGTSTPYYDKATKVTITEDGTTSIELVINENWVLGKPKADNRTDSADENTATVKYEMGRYFLKESDGIPTPDGI